MGRESRVQKPRWCRVCGHPWMATAETLQNHVRVCEPEVEPVEIENLDATPDTCVRDQAEQVLG